MTQPAFVQNILTRLAGMRPGARAGLVTAIGVVLVVVVAVAGIFGARTVFPAVKNMVMPYLGNAHIPLLDNTRSLCADFRDGSGLYKGNKVLLLGVEIGTVSAVTNKPDHVEVDFEIPNDMDLPADVGAASYSQSVITNRSIELTRSWSEGPKFAGNQCISLENTRTPVTVTESFSAIGELADTLMQAAPGQDPANSPGVQALNKTLKGAARSLDGVGPGFREMLNNLTAMVGDPYKADADYRQLFENSAIVTSNWLQYWNEFAGVVKVLPDVARLIAGISDNFAIGLDYLTTVLPTVNGMVQRAAGRIYKNLFDKIVPWVRDILNAYTPHILTFFSTLPPVINWLADDIYLPNTKTHNVTYVPPRVAISPEQASAICQNLRDRNTPGSQAACAPGTASDPVTLGLTNLIMGAALS
ncbi:MlaD family protein [Mycobacteroides sp. LB1]|uniref:MlaD family protein n=1 Tax=Mycobacteroides sp. LB1 TaxID=2750814 RepID=UPI0015DE7B56|nr:MCE family protein [Mycobacteroides sp. LB1]